MVEEYKVIVKILCVILTVKCGSKVVYKLSNNDTRNGGCRNTVVAAYNVVIVNEVIRNGIYLRSNSAKSS